MSEIIGNDPKGNPYENPMDPDKLFSGNRFRRGFRSGLRHLLHAQVFVELPMLGAAILTSPRLQAQFSQDLANMTPEYAALLAAGTVVGETIVGVPMGTAYGVIDSFNPTSKIAKRFLQVDVLRSISEGYQAVKEFDFGQKASELTEKTNEFIEKTKKVADQIPSWTNRILRPEVDDDILDHKSTHIAYSTALTSSFGVGTVGFGWIGDKLIRISDQLVGNSDFFLGKGFIEAINNHPIETVGLYAGLGLTVSTYRILMGRRVDQGATSPDIKIN